MSWDQSYLVLLIGNEPLSDSGITHQKDPISSEHERSVYRPGDYRKHVHIAVGSSQIPAPDFWRLGSIQDVTSLRKDLTQMAIDGYCDSMTSKLFINQPFTITLLYIMTLNKTHAQELHTENAKKGTKQK